MDKYEKMLRKIVDNAKFYPIIQLEEYNRNLQYDYTKKTCVDYNIMLEARDLCLEKKDKEKQ
jgi:hypothetical protein